MGSEKWLEGFKDVSAFRIASSLKVVKEAQEALFFRTSLAVQVIGVARV